VIRPVRAAKRVTTARAKAAIARRPKIMKVASSRSRAILAARQA
jgi:hypothetical protein